MREIKFRGLRVNGKGWVYGYYWVIDEHFTPTLSGINYIKSINNGIDYEVISETVGQFTGLRDKNGKEIYEGDVLTANEYPFQDNGSPNYNAVVKWVFQGFHYVLTCVNTLKRGISEGVNEPLEDAGFFEVIGNIHEKGEKI